MDGRKQPEPWLQGTLQDVPAVKRAVLHALELAEDDLKRWCGGLTEEQMNAQPLGLPPVAFHLRHIARSLERLLTYAEGRSLTDHQLAALNSEVDLGASRDDLFSELDNAMRNTVWRAFELSMSPNSKPRGALESDSCLQRLRAC